MKKRWVAAALACFLALLIALRIGIVRKENAASEARERARANAAAAEAAAAAKARTGAHMKIEPALRPIEPPPEPPRARVNAADLYKQAFALFDELTDDEKRMLKNPRDEVDADKADELFKKIQPILELMRKAGAADYSEWGVGPIRFDTSLAHVQKSVDLGRLALWSAAYRFPTDPQGAVDDLATRARLGRALPDTLLGLVVEASFDRGAVDLVSQNAGALNAAAGARLNEMLRDDAYVADFSRAMQGEVSSVLATADDLSTKTMDDVAKLLGAATGEPAKANDGIERLKAMGYDVPRVVHDLRAIARIEEELSSKFALPDAQFDAWWRQTQAGFATNPFASLTMPAVDSVRGSVREIQVRRAMLGAGMAILQSDPGRLGTFTDPTTGVAFLYTPAVDGSFELRSPFTIKGQPVTMKFPARK
jgi:hypothetical protein